MVITHLVFDLDDTLYAERDFAIGGFRAAALWARDTLGIEVSLDRMLALLDDGHLGKLFHMALAEAKADHSADDLKGFVKAYANQTPQLQLFPDAALALRHWEGRLKLGLITDGHASTQHAKIAALDLTRRFKHIIATGALAPDRAFHKPHPRAFELMQSALGRPGDRFVYVGDNLSKDFIAPNTLGWTTVWIDRPAHHAHRIHKHTTAAIGGEPRFSIGDLAQLQTILA